MVRELLLSCLFLVGCKVGCGFNPAAQSGLGGSGCLGGVDMNVRRDEDELVEDDYRARRVICELQR